jgi:fatty acid CoA ligase FadD36
LRGARLLVSGSAALPAPVAAALGAAAGQVPVERYGMTETLITLAARADAPRRVGWVGTPLAGMATRVVGDDGLPVAADGQAVGDLLVAGPTVMDGYLGRPDATAEVLDAGGWLRTGDVAAVDGDGWHRVLGRRATDLIKSGGYRIGAGEVEAALLGHPAVREAAVVGAPDEDLGQVVVAYVVADGVNDRELADHVAAGLSAHKRPRRVVLVDDLPKNAMGKVQKHLLG